MCFLKIKFEFKKKIISTFIHLKTNVDIHHSIHLTTPTSKARVCFETKRQSDRTVGKLKRSVFFISRSRECRL